MTTAETAMLDPIAPEILRTRLEAIGQEAGAAVEQTAISPVVTESKDYSVTICDPRGSVICGAGVMATWRLSMSIASASDRTPSQRSSRL